MAAGDAMMFQVFQTYVSSVSFECCKSRSGMLYMLQMQYTYVASLCFMCFRRLFQIFHLNVSKIDLVLHMLLWLYTHILI
jgi:hypothetical protein